MKKHLHRVRDYIKAHKVLSSIGAIIILVIVYYGWGKLHPSTSVPSYVLGRVEKGTMVVSVSGTGQVSASDQIDVKAKVSGDVVSVNVVAGQSVKAGASLVHLDSTTAAQDVRQAQAALASSKISLQQTEVTGMQAQGKTADTLTQAYDSGYNTISSMFVNFPTVISDVDDIFYLRDHSPYMTDDNIRVLTGASGLDQKNQILQMYEKAKAQYNKIYAQYKNITRSSPNSDLEQMFDDTYTTAKNMADALKSIRTYIGYLEAAQNQKSTALTQDKATLDADITSVNQKVIDLFSSKTTIENAKNDLTSADQIYAGLAPGINGGSLAVQTAEVAVVQNQNAYQKALDTLADYTITAPFDGVVAELGVKQLDSVSSGTTVATVMSTSQIATISLNELDAAKVTLGQKATLTFDAVPDLTITGKVTQIDSIGTVTQGVVTYGVEITFDTQDARVKSGMSTSASIITNVDSDVLLVPNSAIKTSGAMTTVQVIDNVPAADIGNLQGVPSSTPPHTVPVTVGLSNDDQSEIVSGLNEGDVIVTRTIATAATTASAPARTATSLLGGGGNVARGGFGGGAGAGRATGR